MIVVTGATGFIGRHLVAELLRNGHQVRVLVPPQSIARQLRRRQTWHWANTGEAEVFPGSIFQGESLFQAVQGVHTVFHLASAQWWGNSRDLQQVDIVGTRQVIAAARSARIGRLIYLSHLGAEPSSAYSLLRTKGQAEGLIRASGLAYTIFRTGVVFGEEDRFINNIAMMLKFFPFLTFQPGQGENLINPIYIDDLIAALHNSLESLDLVDETIEIGGGEYISFHELIRTVMRVTGSRRLIVPIPPYVLRWLNNMANIVLPRWFVTRQWFDIISGNRTAKLGNLYDYTAVRPVRFEDTLLTYMPQRRYRFEMLRFILQRRHSIRF